jgi:hypothetical protein
MAEDLQLSCGTSLSEQAHGTLLPPVQEVDKTEPLASKHTSSIQTIDALRAHIAADALTPNSHSHSHTSNHNSNSNSNCNHATPLTTLTTFSSPFELPGQPHVNLTLPMVYCDQTASNRPLQSIEKYLQDTCWPLYGNTHTNTSITGSQSTAFVAEARQLVAEAVNAKTTGKASLDLVLFA